MSRYLLSILYSGLALIFFLIALVIVFRGHDAHAQQGTWGNNFNYGGSLGGGSGGGGSATPGGVSGSVQYNANGSFGGNTGFMQPQIGVVVISTTGQDTTPTLYISSSLGADGTDASRIGIGTLFPSDTVTVRLGGGGDNMAFRTGAGTTLINLANSSGNGLLTVANGGGSTQFSVNANGTAFLTRDFTLGSTATATADLDVRGDARILTDLMIGATATPSATLHVSGTVLISNSVSPLTVLTLANVPGTSYACYDTATGVFSRSNTTCTVSDRRKKTGVIPLPYGLREVLLMEPKAFHMLEQKYGLERRIGLMAQDMEMVVPEVVGHFDDGTTNIDYASLVPVLVQAIKDLEARLVAVERR